MMEESREKFTELYDFAPVGDIDLDENALVRGINLTGATMPGTERAMLPDYPFAIFRTAASACRTKNHPAIRQAALEGRAPGRRTRPLADGRTWIRRYFSAAISLSRSATACLRSL